MTAPALTLVPSPPEPAPEPVRHLQPVPDPPTEPDRADNQTPTRGATLLAFLIDGDGWIPIGCAALTLVCLHHLITAPPGRLGIVGGLAFLAVSALLVLTVGAHRSGPRTATPDRTARHESTVLAGRARCRICGAGTDLTDRAAVQRHEDAHARLMVKYGVGVAWFGKQVFKNGRGYWQGYTTPASWHRMNKLPVVKQMAIYAAGLEAAPNTVSDSDEAVLAQLSHAGKVPVADGRRQARKDLRL